MTGERAANAPTQHNLRLLIATSAANGLAFLPPATLPWLSAHLIADAHMSETLAGGVATMQLALLALFAIGLGATVHRLPRRALALGAGAAATAAAAALTLLNPPAHATIALLCLIGAGAGACCAVANSWLGAAADPGKQTASMWTLLLIWQALLWFVLPPIAEAWGSAGLFGVIAANASVFTLLLLLAPNTKQNAVAAADDRPASARSIPISLLAVALVCTIAFWLRDSLVWSLAAQRADALGVDAHAFSVVLSAGATLGFLGPLAARLLGMRLGALRTLLLTLTPVGVATIAIAAAGLAPFYLGSFLFWSSTSIFAWTIVVGVLVMLDASGRLAAICGGTVFAASALGPFVGGLLLERFSSTALPIAVAALTAVTFLAAIPLARAFVQEKLP